jgi:hypothetical protein
MPTNATGVKVTLDVIDANGNYRNIGETTTDLTGAYSYHMATRYTRKIHNTCILLRLRLIWQFLAQTAIQVDEVTPPSATPIADTAQSMTDTYVLAVGAAIIVAIAIVGAVIVTMLRKRP